MAQLTWRNVDTPNFSGVTDALRLAGQSLQAGLAAGRDAIGDFQKGQTQAESARLMGEIAAETDPSKLPGIIAKYDPRHISQEAMTTALGRPQANANLAQTQASTDASRVSTAFNREINPLKVQEAGLMNKNKEIGNAQAGVNLTQDIWKNKVAQEEYAAQPAYAANVAKYHALKSNLTPEGQAAAATFASSPDFIGSANKAGVKGDSLISVLDKGQAHAAAAVKFNTDYLKMDETQRAAALETSATGLAEQKFKQWGGAAGARRDLMEDPNVDEKLKAATLAKIDALKGNTPAPNEAQVLAGAAAAAAREQAQQPQQPPAQAPGNFVTYRNQGATRDKPLDGSLVQAMSFLPQLGVTMQVTSGGQDGIGEGTKRTGSTRHDHGGAGDVQFIKDGRALDWENPQDVPTLQQIARQARTNGVTGIGAGPGYMNSKTTHIGFGKTAIWGAKGGAPYQALADAVGGVEPGARAKSIISESVSRSANRPGQVVGQAPAPAAAAPAQANPNFQPGLRLETPQDLSTNYQTIQSMLTSSANTSTIDNGLNPIAPIAAAFNKPESETTAAAVVTQLHKTVSGDKENGGILSRDKLTVDNINTAVQQVIKDYGVRPDIAGALVESAIKSTEAFIPLFGNGGRKIDPDKVSAYAGRFIDKEGKPKTEVLAVMGAKKGLEKKIADTKALVEKARDEWLETEAAAQAGNTRIDLKASRARFANAQRAADSMARSIGSNKSLTGFSAGNTGR